VGLRGHVARSVTCSLSVRCRGASAVQLITGMVYMGPAQIGVINRELARLLKRDGYSSVAEAVGKHHNLDKVK